MQLDILIFDSCDNSAEKSCTVAVIKRKRDIYTCRVSNKNHRGFLLNMFIQLVFTVNASKIGNVSLYFINNLWIALQIELNNKQLNKFLSSESVQL